jgi:hypothetical protein
VLAALAQATQRGEACALVDASDALDPASAAAAGVEMGRLLWVRCGRAVPGSQFSVPSTERQRDSHLEKVFRGKNSPQSQRDTEKSNTEFAGRASFHETEFERRRKRNFEQRLEQVLKVTDLLLQSNGFGMIVLDLADIPVRSARRIPLASWFRFRRVVEPTPTVLLVIEQQAMAGSCSSVLVKVTGGGPRVSGVGYHGSEKKPSAFSHQLSVNQEPSSVCPLSSNLEILRNQKGNTPSAKISQTELLDQFEITAELLRSRLDGKPSQPVANFQTRAKWAG